jgi:hypothetical protein
MASIPFVDVGVGHLHAKALRSIVGPCFHSSAFTNRRVDPVKRISPPLPIFTEGAQSALPARPSPSQARPAASSEASADAVAGLAADRVTGSSQTAGSGLIAGCLGNR